MPTVRFQVSGVGCRRCVRTISAAVSDVPGVRTVQVDVARGTVDVTGHADPALVHAAIVRITNGGETPLTVLAVLVLDPARPPFVPVPPPAESDGPH